MNDWSKSNDSLSPQLNRHSRIVTLRDSSDLSEFSLDQGTSQTGSRLNNHHFDVIALHPNNEDNPNDVSSSEFLLDLANRPDQANNQTGGRLNNQRDHDFENTQVDPGNNNEDRVYEDMTFEQVEDTDLTPKESFIFMLGMLNRIEKYSETLIDGVHGKWYKNNIAMVKIVLIKSYSLFKSENLRRHIGNKPSQTQVHKDNNGSELKKLKKRGVKAKKKVVFRGKKDNQYSSTQAELNIDDEANIETLEVRFGLDKSELRRSQYLQIKDKKDVFCDKIKKKSQHSNTQVEVNIDYEENTEIPEKIFSLDKLETRRSQRLQIKDKKDVFCDKIKKKSQHSNTQVEVNIDYEENTEIPEKIFSLDKLETRRSQRLQIKDKKDVFCDKIKKKSQHSNTQVEVNIDYEENTEIPEKIFSLDKLETRRSQRLQIKDKKDVFCDKIKKKSQHSNTQVEVNIDYEENTEIPEKIFSLDKLETRRSQRLQIKDEVLKSDNIQKHNGSLGIDDTPSQTQIHEVNNSSELKKLKKRCVKAKKKVVSNGKSDNQCSSTEVELNTDDQENTKPPEKSLGKSEPRRSQRLQIDDREVFSDRLEYVDLKLAAATFTPLPERLNKSLSAKQRTVKRKSRSSCGISSKRGRNSGKASLNSTVPTSSQENVTLGTVVNKSRQSSQACKRLSKNPSRKRAKSLDLKSRNGKGGSGTQDASPVLEKTNTLASTSSTSLFDKRNLYSVDSWLDSFP
ncbi:nuclease SbcCD subunit C-like isoform X4 [Tenebrio molitor]|uniref:nuclease SbcCD subunit C-like isoform X4 n=1 Tax=Tenebrio molitor TaxID=7067 RepID=UPI0036248087